MFQLAPSIQKGVANNAQVKDLDSSLGAKELGEMHAFAALVSAKLIPATVRATEFG